MVLIQCDSGSGFFSEGLKRERVNLDHLGANTNVAGAGATQQGLQAGRLLLSSFRPTFRLLCVGGGRIHLRPPRLVGYGAACCRQGRQLALVSLFLL